MEDNMRRELETKLRELKDMQDDNELINELINCMYEQEYLYKRNTFWTKMLFFIGITLALMAVALINEFINVPMMLIYRIGTMICLLGMIMCSLDYLWSKRM